VPPKRTILRDISLSFFPGAKIGVLGLNGSGKSTLLKIMAGLDEDFDGEARPQAGIRVGYLPQEPQLDASKDVRGNIEEALGEIKHLKEFLKEFNKELKALPFDIGKLSKELKKLEKTLKGGKKVYLPPIRLERKKKKSLWRRFLNLFKGLPIFR